VFRALRPFVERDPDTVLICDGGEFAQWGQSMLPLRRRLINGVAGSIGSSLSFALAARMIEHRAPVFAVSLAHRVEKRSTSTAACSVSGGYQWEC